MKMGGQLFGRPEVQDSETVEDTDSAADSYWLQVSQKIICTNSLMLTFVWCCISFCSENRASQCSAYSLRTDCKGLGIILSLAILQAKIHLTSPNSCAVIELVFHANDLPSSSGLCTVSYHFWLVTRSRQSWRKNHQASTLYLSCSTLVYWAWGRRWQHAPFPSSATQEWTSFGLIPNKQYRIWRLCIVFWTFQSLQIWQPSVEQILW